MKKKLTCPVCEKELKECFIVVFPSIYPGDYDDDREEYISQKIYMCGCGKNGGISVREFLKFKFVINEDFESYSPEFIITESNNGVHE